MTTAPDYVFPIVGCRVWRWDETGLKSLSGFSWQPGRAVSAKCFATHESPQRDCQCGFYAAKTFGHLQRMGYTEGRRKIRGEVFLWGRVVEHEDGWRAQFAYPKNFIVPVSALPSVMSRIESRLASLIAYRRDIFLLAEKKTVPLWLTASEFDPKGIDLIVQRCRAFDERRRNERRINPGDRVAVLGHGIAMVEHVDNGEVQAVLGGKSVLTVERERIVWCEQYSRWETAVGESIGLTARKEPGPSE